MPRKRVIDPESRLSISITQFESELGATQSVTGGGHASPALMLRTVINRWHVPRRLPRQL